MGWLWIAILGHHVQLSVNSLVATKTPGTVTCHMEAPQNTCDLTSVLSNSASSNANPKDSNTPVSNGTKSAGAETNTANTEKLTSPIAIARLELSTTDTGTSASTTLLDQKCRKYLPLHQSHPPTHSQDQLDVVAEDC